MFHHITVLQKETIEAILPASINDLGQDVIEKKEFVVVDCTLGGGGHALQLVQDFPQSPLFLYGVDRDDNALQTSRKRLEETKSQHKNFQFRLFHANFSEFFSLFESTGLHQQIDGLYADLGVSSPQIDVATRGFSFLKSGPLDMRMDARQNLSAADILQTYSETELFRIFKEYGEEPKSRILAKAICKDRTQSTNLFNDTLEFASYVAHILKYKNSRTHPATRIFQALRIEVNDELGSVKSLLEQIPRYISDDGKVAIITFHSLEDRLVKQAMRYWESEDKDEVTGGTPQHLTLSTKLKWGREFPRGGISPSGVECSQNSRARSARLRIFQFGKRSHRRPII